MAKRGKSPRPPGARVRWGVVGLGYFAQAAILPAFAHARHNSELLALFSDTPRKLAALGRRYRVAGRHSYDDFDAVLRAGGIDAVYIALPNHLHCDFTVRAARAGVHVLCEKPMAVTEKDCQAMIAACARRRVKLMIAYRLHFERANLTAAELVRSGELGEPRIFNSLFANQVKDPDNVRLNELRLGGGTLYDIGIYCLNAARALFRSEPVEALALAANNGEARFAGLDEMTAAVLRFPGERLATFVSSFAAHDHNHYEVLGTKGRIRVEPAFEFARGLGWEAQIGGRKRSRRLKKSDQVAPEILYFADCVLEDREPEPSGREGLADVRVLRALMRSAATGRKVRLAPFVKRPRPTLEQQIRRPAVPQPELVAADPPSGA
jgi:glucose-fructose oxidoreductase